MFVMLVAAAKTHFENQALVAGTKQSRQADKAGRQRQLIVSFLSYEENVECFAYSP
jgi:hypothetical protein